MRFYLFRCFLVVIFIIYYYMALSATSNSAKKSIEMNEQWQVEFTVVIEYSAIRTLHMYEDEVFMRIWTEVNGAKVAFPQNAVKVTFEDDRLPDATLKWPLDLIDPHTHWHRSQHGDMSSAVVCNTLMQLLMSLHPTQFTEKKPTQTLLIEFFIYYGLTRISHCVDLITSAGRLEIGADGQPKLDAPLGFGLFNEPAVKRMIAYVKPAAITHCPDFVKPNFALQTPIVGRPLDARFLSKNIA